MTKVILYVLYRTRPVNSFNISDEMKAREACAGSLYQAAVRRTHDGRFMIFGKTHGRAFIQTFSETGRPDFQEVKRKFVEEVLNYNDWKPWTEPLGLQDFLRTKEGAAA